MATAAERMQRTRERRSRGVRVLHVEVEMDTVETLVELDYLNVEDVRNYDAVADAVSRFLVHATDSVTCNAITLDTW